MNGEKAVRVYLGLGANLGDREAAIGRAMLAIEGIVALDGASSLYETEPWGYKDQPSFLNSVCTGVTELAPRSLLNRLKAVENEMGRETTFRYGPRSIDIDILFYGDWIVDEDGLTIPHPSMTDRAFVLVPLSELAPDLVHPSFGKRVSELLVELVGTSETTGRLPEGISLWKEAPGPLKSYRSTCSTV